jgi:hypothetical protein
MAKKLFIRTLTDLVNIIKKFRMDSHFVGRFKTVRILNIIRRSSQLFIVIGIHIADSKPSSVLAHTTCGHHHSHQLLSLLLRLRLFFPTFTWTPFSRFPSSPEFAPALGQRSQQFLRRWKRKGLYDLVGYSHNPLAGMSRFGS